MHIKNCTFCKGSAVVKHGRKYSSGENAVRHIRIECGDCSVGTNMCSNEKKALKEWTELHKELT